VWLPDKSRLVKVRLHDQGEDVETPWAEDLGPIGAGLSARRVRLGNVPFLHAKPTYEDVIEVETNGDDGMLEWDRQDVPFEQTGSRLYEDSGRWAVMIDYEPGQSGDLSGTFKALDIAAEEADIAVEGAFVRDDDRSGRAYLAVPCSMEVTDVLAWLRSPDVNLRFTLVHPVDDE
jgi:hypothetical protein